MKRCFFLFLLILCLRPCLAGAEEDDALYPIRENGLWGYMNRQGEIHSGYAKIRNDIAELMLLFTD